MYVYKPCAIRYIHTVLYIYIIIIIIYISIVEYNIMCIAVHCLSVQVLLGSNIHYTHILYVLIFQYDGVLYENKLLLNARIGEVSPYIHSSYPIHNGWNISLIWTLLGQIGVERCS